MQFDPYDIDALLAFHRANFGDAQMVEGDEPDPDAPKDDPAKPQEGDTETFDEERAKAKIAKTNSEAAALRKRVLAAEAKVKEFEDAGKTESDKLTERATASEKRAETAEQKLVRLEVAVAKGLTAAQAKRLVGSTQEELEADADELLAEFGGSTDGTPKPKVPAKPQEALRGGGDPEQEPEETDPAKLAARIRRRY